MVIDLLGRAIFAAGKSYMTGQSFGESWRGIPDFGVKVEDTLLGSGKTKLPGKAIKIRGMVPVPYDLDLVIFIKLFDITDGNEPPDRKSVISLIDYQQEPDSIAFRSISNIGRISPSQGFKDWVQIGAVVPNFMDVPYSGKRKIEAVLIFIDRNKCPDPENYNFRPSPETGLVHIATSIFESQFDLIGYEEAQDNQEEGNALSIKIAIAVAMADGSLDDNEGLKINEWIKKKISFYDSKKKKQLKDNYNSAMKEAYRDAKKSDLILSDLTKRLEEIGDKRSKYDAIELCYEVMAADGVAEPEELKMIGAIAKSLSLDSSEIEIMRDKQLVNVSSNLSTVSLEETLGIKPDWPADKIKKHLRQEFQKWNGRINVVEDAQERENIQRRLDDIAELRKKYGS